MKMIGRASVGVSAALVLAFAGNARAALVGYWSGNGTTNDSVSANNGTLVGGATYASGPDGEVFSLNGSGQYVAIADSAAYHFGTGDFSVSYKVEFNAIVDGGTAMVSKDNYSGSSTYNGFLTDDNDDGMAFVTRDITGGTGPQTIAAEAASNFQTGVWYDFAAVRSANVLSLYVNGTLVSTQTESSLTDVTNTSEFRIGALSDAFPQYLNGEISDVGLYNSALSQAQVEAMVPEPASAGLLVVSTIGLLLRRRRSQC